MRRSSPLWAGEERQAVGALALEQEIAYSYDQPIHQLRHRLVVVPPEFHGTQARRDFSLSVSHPAARVRFGTDAFSNCVVSVEVGEVADHITFSLRATVTVHGDQAAPEPRHLVHDRRLLRPSALTGADGALADAARMLALSGGRPVEIGELACAWTSRAMSYGHGTTDVQTTAAAALAGGRGVCQDYAHIMLALCRAAGVSARYVSGHLIGEGGSHAWVEVLDEAASGRGSVAVGFDPTHDRRTDSRYLAVAVGRDYADVAPTSGTFRGQARGELTVRKRLLPLPADGINSLGPMQSGLAAGPALASARLRAS
jgi:transglutaminase-like putative cysteine protease